MLWQNVSKMSVSGKAPDVTTTSASMQEELFKDFCAMSNMTNSSCVERSKVHKKKKRMEAS